MGAIPGRTPKEKMVSIRFAPTPRNARWLKETAELHGCTVGDVMRALVEREIERAKREGILPKEGDDERKNN